eukprot:scaffold153616_cov50-Attheya_sp.AAC.1
MPKKRILFVPEQCAAWMNLICRSIYVIPDSLISTAVERKAGLNLKFSIPLATQLLVTRYLLFVEDFFDRGGGRRRGVPRQWQSVVTLTEGSYSDESRGDELLGEIPRTQGQRVPPGNGLRRGCRFVCDDGLFRKARAFRSRLRQPAAVLAKLCRSCNSTGVTTAV